MEYIIAATFLITIGVFVYISIEAVRLDISRE